MMDNRRGNISRIIEGLTNESPKYLGDNDVVSVDSTRMASAIEDKMTEKYEKALSSIGTEPGFSVEVECSSDFEDVGIPDALDSISIGLFFDSLSVDVNTAIKELKKILKKYAWAGIEYSKKDGCFLIDTIGMFNSFEMIDTLRSDGINLDRFYNIVSSSEIEDY